MLRKLTLAAACLAVIASTGCRSDRNSCGANQCGSVLPAGQIPGPIPGTASYSPVDPAYTGGSQIAPYGGVRSLPAAAPSPFRGVAPAQTPPAEPRETRRFNFDI